MNVLKLSNTPAESTYHGCGKAWIAIKDDTPVSIKYMGDFVFNEDALPAWCKAVIKSYCGISEPRTEASRIASVCLAKIKKSAIDAGHPATGPLGGHIKASKIARDAQRIIWDEESHQFSEYRLAARAELAEKGDVKSGMCSCYEFIIN